MAVEFDPSNINTLIFLADCPMTAIKAGIEGTDRRMSRAAEAGNLEDMHDELAAGNYYRKLELRILREQQNGV